MKTIVKVAILLSLVLTAAFPRGAAAQGQPAVLMIESLEFREVDIKDILRQLAKQYGLNIVFSESVKGLVTVQLTQVSIDQALDSIITVNGFAYTKKENVYKVTTMEEAEREGKQTKLFKLSNADASKIKVTLAKVLTASGSIEADVRSNSIVVTDSLVVINKIEAMIPQLDEITPQVLIEAKIIETSLTTSEKLGIDWTTTIQAAGASRPTTFPFNNWGSAKDMYPSQDYSSSVSGTTTTVTSDFAFKGESYLSPGQSAGFSAFPMATAEEFVFGTLNFQGLKAIMGFLEQRSDTKLIASPRIMTINNQKATINVGQVVPIAIYELNETRGTWEITGWQEQNIGINLEVLPQISPDGHIKMKLKPEVSTIIDSVGEGVNERPVTSTRTAETEVQIRDGQTVVIGGLVKNVERKQVKKIPFLSSLPIIGKLLFTSQEKGTDESPEEKTDLLIFVTAHIIKDGDGSTITAENTKGRPFKTKPRETTDAN